MNYENINSIASYHPRRCAVFGGSSASTHPASILVPYADFNLLRFPDREQAFEKIRDLTCLSDILPTGYHGAVTAGVTGTATAPLLRAIDALAFIAAPCKILDAPPWINRAA